MAYWLSRPPLPMTPPGSRRVLVTAAGAALKGAPLQRRVLPWWCPSAGVLGRKQLALGAPSGDKCGARALSSSLWHDSKILCRCP